MQIQSRSDGELSSPGIEPKLFCFWQSVNIEILGWTYSLVTTETRDRSPCVCSVPTPCRHTSPAIKIVC